ncbi:MAG: hypothetical protein ACERIE_06380, partial [Methyloceanibacter sp.]
MNAKVREAADYLAKKGRGGLEIFNKADSPFVWKDTYVFVFDCAAGITDLAHPVASTRNRWVATDKDAAGNVGMGSDMIHYATIRPHIMLTLPEGDVVQTSPTIPVEVTPVDPYG